MHYLNWQGRAAASVLAAALLFSAAAHAQKPPGLPGDYPARPVRVIVGSAAGGGSDTLARQYSGRLSERWGANFLVENIATGISGVIALQQLYKAAPDGYTLLYSSGGVFQNATFTNNDKLNFDVRKAFTPIAQTTFQAQIMALYPKAPYTSLKELIAYAKANPGVVNFGTSGVGSAAHLLGEYVSDMAGIKMTHVPYKGAGPSTLDAVAGRIEVVFGSQQALIPHVNAGRLRLVGISAPQRMPLQPDIPTIAEQGLPGFRFTSWQGWFGPAGLPAPIVRALNAEVNRISEDPNVRKVLLADGANPVAYPPEQFARTIVDDLDQVDAILKKTGIKLSE